ncbi:serine/threonine-protein phosphatase with EF-hands 2 isoform X1 [Danio rerio]|uniref:Serine/threonine-protein phosphatase n=1 Tax=Danio rerio TaxID=7955 RepID=A0A8M3ASP8_DANRE
MGCGVTKNSEFNRRYDKDGNVISAARTIKAAVLIQRWHKQYVARMEMRRRYTWNIFQSMEYADLQDQIKLYNFLGYLVDNFTPSSSERNLISHIFRENEVCRDAEWERYFNYTNIDVPDIYSGPRLTFPLDMDQAADLVEAFKNKQQQLHSRYVLQLLLETWKLLRVLPNINRVSTCHSKEITICGDLHGQLEDLLLIFYKNGMPSMEKPYVFNGDYVDRGKDSMEVLLILFTFLLVYPGDVYLNRGNHEDHIINLRYGFTKEVLGKYKLHGKRILKLLQKIFSWLPLVTVIDQRVLIVHGGISDSTNLALIARVDRHRYVSALRPPRKTTPSCSNFYADSEHFGKVVICQNRRGSLTFPSQFGARDSFQRRSLQDFSRTVARTVEEELEVRRRQAEFSLSSFSKSQHILRSTQSTESEPESSEFTDTSNDEWKQILDLLWSDPMSQDGCVPNEVRGGGCYWGPNITEDFLNRHNLQLIIRSHECKQDGYEFCHNRKVVTLFSASNYYEIGSNRGAFVRLGPDLMPYFIQYQATSMTRGLSFPQNVKRTEHTALKVLREKLFAHKSDLLSAFQELDKENTGLISLSDWARAVERVLHLDLPWRILHPQLVSSTTNGMLNYHGWFCDLALKKPNSEVIEQSMLETLYRHRSTLETIFRIVDTDNSGLISFEDFRQTLKLLSAYLKMEISDEVINELVVSMDTNNDGSIDIDEFMEAFRLVDKSRLERGKSLLQLRQDIQRLPREEESSQTADSCQQTSHIPVDSTCSQTSHSPASQTADCQSLQTDDLCHISVDVPP